MKLKPKPHVQPGDSELTTSTLKPSKEVADALEAALAQTKSLTGLEKAVAIMEAAQKTAPSDHRIHQLLGSFRRELANLHGTKVTSAKVAHAFSNLANGAKRLRTAAQGVERVSHQAGAEPTEFDRRMMRGVVKLCETPVKEYNTPATTILTAGDKIVAIGLNRSYNPIPSYKRHGEMEALEGLQQRIYTGIAQILIMHRDRGGELSETTKGYLSILEHQGIGKDKSLRLNPKDLERRGYFSKEKIAKYDLDLQAIVEEGLFHRDGMGNLHPRHREVFNKAIGEGIFAGNESADWDVLDKIHSRDPDTKLTLYTSLEPCGMCLQNCTSHGSIGRIVYGAKDEAGGGISTLEQYADLYFKLGRVPLELVGGVEGERAQQMYDHFFEKIYPLVRQGMRPTVDAEAPAKD